MKENRVIEERNTSQRWLRATIFLFMMFSMVVLMSNLINASLCYQESSNTTNQTGIDGNCGLSYSGSVNSEVVSGPTGYIYENYTKPSNSNSAYWFFALGGRGNQTILIPNACYIANNSKLILRFVGGIYGGETDCQLGIYAQCYNGLSWENLGSNTDLGGCNGYYNGALANAYDGNFSTYTVWNGTGWGNHGYDTFEFYEDAVKWVINSSTIFFTSSGNGTQSYRNTTGNHTINYTITDIILNSCWLNYNSTNRTIPCTSGAVNTTNFTLQYNLWNATLWANDTLGNTASQFFSWTYPAFENSQTYTTPVTSGSNQTFTINLSYDSSTYSNIAATLFYNGTSYTGTKVGTGNSTNFTRSINVPSPSTSTAYPFYWEIMLNNGTSYYVNSTAKTQTVGPISIDNCSINQITLYNFTIVDEDTQTKLTGTTKNTLGNINIQLYTLAGVAVSSYATKFNQTNPFGICFNASLATGESYKIDVQVQYSADNYQKEYYHIQKDTIDLTDFATNITLYDLSTASASQGTTINAEYNVSNYTSTSTTTYAGSGYVFKITYKDENFFPVSGAIIQIQRKYVDEGLFKTVEIPMTDSNGQTTASLVKNTAIYTFVVVKNGVILATFDNVVAVCQNEVLGQCEINLNAYSTTVSTTDYTKLDDFSFTKAWNLTTRTFTFTYTIPSGTAKTVLINATLADGLGTTSICSDTLTSASGTLTCIVPAGYMNQTAIFKVYSDGIQKVEVVIPITQSSKDTFGGSIVFLSIFLILMIIGAAVTESPMLTGFMLLVGLVVGFAVSLFGNAGFYGVGATILWIIIAIIIVLVKGSGRQ